MCNVCTHSNVCIDSVYLNKYSVAIPRPFGSKRENPSWWHSRCCCSANRKSKNRLLKACHFHLFSKLRKAALKPYLRCIIRACLSYYEFRLREVPYHAAAVDDLQRGAVFIIEMFELHGLHWSTMVPFPCTCGSPPNGYLFLIGCKPNDTEGNHKVETRTEHKCHALKLCRSRITHDATKHETTGQSDQDDESPGIGHVPSQHLSQKHAHITGDSTHVRCSHQVLRVRRRCGVL